MKQVLQLEEMAQMILGIAGLYFQSLHFSWWLWPILFLSPDISFLGYGINTTVGAIVYNIFHHKGIAMLMILLGLVSNQQAFLIIGIVLFGHSSMDRFFGYGLKYSEGFKYTHLGKIGKE